LKIAVVGAGWAGLASAYQLKQSGAEVTVFEAAPMPGGRARSFSDEKFVSVDNGQHLLLGAYTQCLELIAQLNPNRPTEHLMERLPLNIQSADGSFQLRARALPGGLHTLIALIGARGLKIRDKWLAIRMMQSLRRRNWRIDADATVEQLLTQHCQSKQINQTLWHPLCLASMNTDATQASAQLFLNVLRDTLDAPMAHSDLIIPKVDLSALWAQAAAKQLSMRYRHIVRKIQINSQSVSVDGESFDRCISALPPYALARVLSCNEADKLHELLSYLSAFTYNAIATLTLKLEHPWQLPKPLLLLKEDASQAFLGQWVFNRSQHSDQINVVISASDDHLRADRNTFVSAIEKQIRQQVSKHPLSSHAMPRVIDHKLIIEKRATFVAKPSLHRPSVVTTWPRFFLAGDFTDTGYPAVLEGAIRSGIEAAKAALK